MSQLPADAGRGTQSIDCEPTPLFHIETWGCQMNVLDGQRMAGQLESRGYQAAGDVQGCDVVLLNTCAVREKAEWKVYSALGVLARRKRENPRMVIGVTGCVAQVSGEEILERAPWVDFVVGTGEVERIGELVDRARKERVRAAYLDLPQVSPSYPFAQVSRDSSFQAYVMVIEGCDQFCTFCIVPFTRGRERSRASSEVFAEVEHLSRRGFTEVTLLGQTVNAYRDPEEGIGLGSLLRRASKVEGIRRVRFLTSHPSFVDRELIDAIAERGAIAPYLHLPAQSGSDRVLYRMKRRYDRRKYLNVIESVRRARPDIAVSSDFIVGFPGESEEDFSQSLELLREVRFASVFAFRYSPRPGTAAARWGSEAQVDEEVAADRLARLLALQEQIQAEINEGLVGLPTEILVEGRNRRGQITGRSPCNRVVHVQSSLELSPGAYLPVRITKGLPNSLLAEPV
jgi:tRNA-2-methylthio-N6-dimethylallyladenosine synthase